MISFLPDPPFWIRPRMSACWGEGMRYHAEHTHWSGFLGFSYYQNPSVPDSNFRAISVISIWFFIVVFFFFVSRFAKPSPLLDTSLPSVISLLFRYFLSGYFPKCWIYRRGLGGDEWQRKGLKGKKRSGGSEKGKRKGITGRKGGREKGEGN